MGVAQVSPGVSHRDKSAAGRGWKGWSGCVLLSPLGLVTPGKGSALLRGEDWGCWEAEIPAGVLPSEVFWEMAANTRLCPQIHKDWEGEEESSVSIKIPPLFKAGCLKKCTF